MSFIKLQIQCNADDAGNFEFREGRIESECILCYYPGQPEEDDPITIVEVTNSDRVFAVKESVEEIDKLILIS